MYRDELKTSSALSAIGRSGKSCSLGLVTLILYGTDVKLVKHLNVSSLQ